MSFAFDPIFHTKTMAKILKDQGHLRSAEKVCREILAKNPIDQTAEILLESILSSLSQNRAPFLSSREKADSAAQAEEGGNDPEEEETTI